jgi:hypothetical protein
MYLYCEVTENFQAYAVAKHRHVPEIEQVLADQSGRKTIAHVCAASGSHDPGHFGDRLRNAEKENDHRRGAAGLRRGLRGERFIRLLPEGRWPQTKDTAGTNYVDINVTIDERNRRVVVLAALDNLVKGASGQAVQNMNLLFGLSGGPGNKIRGTLMGLIAWIKRLAGLSKDQKTHLRGMQQAVSSLKKGNKSFSRNGVCLNPNGAPPAVKTPGGTGGRGGDNHGDRRSAEEQRPAGGVSTCYGLRCGISSKPGKKTWRSSGPTGRPEPRAFSPTNLFSAAPVQYCEKKLKGSRPRPGRHHQFRLCQRLHRKTGPGGHQFGRRKNWPGIGVENTGYPGGVHRGHRAPFAPARLGPGD